MCAREGSVGGAGKKAGAVFGPIRRTDEKWA